MNDARGLLLAVLIGVDHAELLGKHLVNLNGDKRIFLAVHVLNLDIELRAVERSFADADLVRNLEVVEDALHEALCLVPLLFRTDILCTVIRVPLREAVGNVLIQTECLQHEDCKLQALSELIFQLLRCAHEVAFGNGELAHTDQAVHLAACFITEQCGGLVVAQRQVAVGTLAV